jgi:hypothetical protein
VSQCQRCGAKSALFLCNNHTDELRDMFNELPRLAHHLAEAATGQTRLGEPARRTRSDEQPMRINLRASDLLDDVNRILVRWVQDMCDSHRVIYHAPEDGDGDTAKLAIWLGHNVNAIAAGDDAGMCMDEISGAVHRILTTINRPIPPRFCGPCPSAHPEDEARQCNMALMARRDAIDVRCPQCTNTHNVDYLLRRLLTEVDHWRFTVKEVLMIMETLGDPVHVRTFQRWRKLGIVKPAGYKRVDGRVVIKAHQGDNTEPMYRLADVRRAKTKTGAGS